MSERRNGSHIENKKKVLSPSVYCRRQHGKCLQLGHEPKANLSYFSFMRPKFVKGVCTMFKMLGHYDM